MRKPDNFTIDISSAADFHKRYISATVDDRICLHCKSNIALRGSDYCGPFCEELGA